MVEDFIASAKDARQVGQHLVWIEPPNIAVTYWRGVPTGDDMSAVYALYNQLLPPDSDVYGCSIINESGAPTLAARRIAASDPIVNRFRSMSFVGANFHLRVLIELVTRAQAALSKKPTPEVKFFDELPDALYWLRARQKFRESTSP